MVLIMAHAGGKFHGKENSVELINKTKELNYQILELDLRKSFDGVLYCYHGFPYPKFFIAYLFRLLPFSIVKKLCKANTLKELLDVAPKDKIIYLDIKEKFIYAKEIHNVCKDFPHKVWIAAYKLKYLKNFKKVYKDKYKYVYNFGFLTVKKGIRKCLKATVDQFHIFPWQCSLKNIQAIKAAGLEHAVSYNFFDQKTYEQFTQKYDSQWICNNRLYK